MLLGEHPEPPVGIRTVKNRTLAASIAASALVLVAIGPAVAFDNPVDIYAALDLPTFGDGPRTFEVTGVVVGDGPELTGTDETANPSDWCGDILVDIDPVAQTITVSADQEVCNFETVVVRITTAEIASVAVVSDGPAEVSDDEDAPIVPGAALEVTVDETGVLLSWTMFDDFDFDMSGVSVFSYLPVAPVDVPATPAAPVVVAPAFTG